MKEDFKKFLLIALCSILCSSCCKTRENDMLNQGISQGVHQLNIDILTSNVQDPFNLFLPEKYDSILIGVIDDLGGFGHVYFENEGSFNQHIKAYNDSFTASGFDFGNYLLMPLLYYDQFIISIGQLQTIALLNYNDKTLTIKINSVDRICKKVLPGREMEFGEVYYNNWLKVPRPPTGFRIQVEIKNKKL